MTIFADGWLLSNSPSQDLFDRLKWNLGAGITFDTPLGPARIDYAVQIENLERSEIQLGVQSLFWNFFWN